MKKNNRYDLKIEELLFLDLSTDMENNKRLISLLPNLDDAEKHKLIILLKNRLDLFMKMNKGNFFKKELLQKRIKDWTDYFREPSFDEIALLYKNMDLDMGDILKEKLGSPKGIKNMLEKYVIGQETYLRKISTLLYNHLLRMESEEVLPMANLLVYGPSGSGKTFGIQTISKMFNVEVIIINCNSIVQEGIKGTTISNVFSFYAKTKGIKNVENAIVLFDEFDKLLQKGEYNSRIIDEILSVIDDNGQLIFMLEDVEGKKNETVKISTKKMTFVFSGVFEKLEKIVSKRINNDVKIGFLNSKDNKDFDYRQYVTFEDFETLGIKTEILGRIQNHTWVKKLDIDDYESILLHSKESPFIQYFNFFKKHNCEIELTNCGAEEIAKLAFNQKMGVRGMKGIVYNLLEEEMFLVKENAKKEMLINAEFVKTKFNKSV